MNRLIADRGEAGIDVAVQIDEYVRGVRGAEFIVRCPSPAGTSRLRAMFERQEELTALTPDGVTAFKFLITDLIERLESPTGFSFRIVATGDPVSWRPGDYRIEWDQ